MLRVRSLCSEHNCVCLRASCRISRYRVAFRMQYRRYECLRSSERGASELTHAGELTPNTWMYWPCQACSHSAAATSMWPYAEAAIVAVTIGLVPPRHLFARRCTLLWHGPCLMLHSMRCDLMGVRVGLRVGVRAPRSRRSRSTVHTGRSTSRSENTGIPGIIPTTG